MANDLSQSSASRTGPISQAVIDDSNDVSCRPSLWICRSITPKLRTVGCDERMTETFSTQEYYVCRSGPVRSSGRRSTDGDEKPQTQGSNGLRDQTSEWLVSSVLYDLSSFASTSSLPCTRDSFPFTPIPAFDWADSVCFCSPRTCDSRLDCSASVCVQHEHETSHDGPLLNPWRVMTDRELAVLQTAPSFAVSLVFLLEIAGTLFKAETFGAMSLT